MWKNIAGPISNANEKNSLIIKAMLHKRETRTLKSLFSILSVGEFILDQENKNNITFKWKFSD